MAFKSLMKNDVIYKECYEIHQSTSVRIKKVLQKRKGYLDSIQISGL